MRHKLFGLSQHRDIRQQSVGTSKKKDLLPSFSDGLLILWLLEVISPCLPLAEDWNVVTGSPLNSTVTPKSHHAEMGKSPFRPRPLM